LGYFGDRQQGEFDLLSQRSPERPRINSGGLVVFLDKFLAAVDLAKRNCTNILQIFCRRVGSISVTNGSVFLQLTELHALL